MEQCKHKRGRSGECKHMAGKGKLYCKKHSNKIDRIFENYYGHVLQKISERIIRLLGKEERVSGFYNLPIIDKD